MNERELKVIRQRIAARLETREDAQALADEVDRLRLFIRRLAAVAETTSGDSEVGKLLRQQLGEAP